MAPAVAYSIAGSEMFRLLLATNQATSQSPLIERLCKILRDPLMLSDGAQVRVMVALSLQA